MSTTILSNFLTISFSFTFTNQVSTNSLTQISHYNLPQPLLLKGIPLHYYIITNNLSFQSTKQFSNYFLPHLISTSFHKIDTKNYFHSTHLLSQCLFDVELLPGSDCRVCRRFLEGQPAPKEKPNNTASSCQNIALVFCKILKRLNNFYVQGNSKFFSIVKNDLVVLRIV